VAAAGGIFLPHLYRGNAWVLSATRGQDVYTLAVAVPAMAVTWFAMRQGSLRAILVMMGITGYMLYTYIGAAFAFSLNEFFPIYVALMSLSLFAIAGLVSASDAAHIDSRFESGAPRKPIAIFLIAMGSMLLLMESLQLIPFYVNGTLPLAMQLAESTNFFPLAMDMGLVAPLTILAGIALLRRLPLGYLLSSCMLVKAATMGLALLATNGYAWMMGTTVDSIGLLLSYGFIGFGGLGMAVWFFRYCGT
jgi:hypothetical protein